MSKKRPAEEREPLKLQWKILPVVGLNYLANLTYATYSTFHDVACILQDDVNYDLNQNLFQQEASAAIEMITEGSGGNVEWRVPEA